MNKYLVKLLCLQQAVQILLQVLDARIVFVDSAQTGYAITKRSNLLVKICAISLLDHVVCCLLGSTVPTVLRGRGLIS